MRQRMIKPTFWKDRKIGKVSREARLLAIGLRNYVDDSGRGEYDAHLIRLELFPWDENLADEDVEKWLRELDRVRLESEADGGITRYEVNGRKYFFIPEFSQEQYIKFPSKPRCPEPPKAADCGSAVVGLAQGYPSAGAGLAQGYSPNLNQTKLKRKEINQTKPIGKDFPKGPEQRRIPGIPAIGAVVRRPGYSVQTQAETSRAKAEMLLAADEIYSDDGMKIIREVIEQIKQSDAVREIRGGMTSDPSAFAVHLFYAADANNPVGRLRDAVRHGQRRRVSEKAKEWARGIMKAAKKAANGRTG